MEDSEDEYEGQNEIKIEKIKKDDTADIFNDYAKKKANILSILKEIFGGEDSKEKKNSISKENFAINFKFIFLQQSMN